MLYNDLEGTILRQSHYECKYMRMWDEFEHGEVNEERAYDAEVAQDKANFKDRLAKEEANFQLQQILRQEEFQCAHLSWEVDFKSSQLKEYHDIEASPHSKGSKIQGGCCSKKTGSMGKDQKGVTGRPGYSCLHGWWDPAQAPTWVSHCALDQSNGD